MNTDTPKEKTPKEEPMLKCTVIVPAVEIGDLICGKGHQITLPKSQAETLADMKPPRVSIDGI